MSPQHQIFNEIFKVSSNLGYATYDYLPAEEAKLPFVFVGEQFDDDITTKSFVYGNVIQRIHIYHDYRSRSTLTGMMDALKADIRRLKHTSNFYIKVKSMSAQTLPDNSTAQKLLRGIIEVEIQFN